MFKILLIIIAVLLLIEIILLLQLKSQVGRYKDYWEAQNNLPIRDGSIHYIALGDSGAQGIGATSPRKGYVGLLANRISEKYGKPVHVTNLSVSGATIEDVIKLQIPELEALNTDENTIVTLSVGGNDAIHDKLSEIEKHLKDLCPKLPKQTVVAELGNWRGTRYWRLDDESLKFNDALHRVADKYEFKVAPVRKHTKKHSQPQYQAADVLHPSNLGYKSMRDAFVEVMDL